MHTRTPIPLPASTLGEQEFGKQNGSTFAGGQYFRDFANFGAPLPVESPKQFFAHSSHVKVSSDVLQDSQSKYITQNRHPYWSLISGCLTQAWMQLRYIPFVVKREYTLRHPASIASRIRKAIGNGELY